MCGLAGFVRHPEAPDFKFSVDMVLALLEAHKHRGKDATGFAASGGKDQFIFKIAEPVEKVMKMPVFQTAVDRIKDDTTVLMGHVRWATTGPKNSDYAAHPFKYGAVVGAHNGHINNWLEIERMFALAEEDKWLVDSQAIFAVLNRFKSPVHALERLEGYFAVTWVKNGKFFIAKTKSPEFSCAYVKTLKTMFWASERRLLVPMLKNSGLAEEEFYVWSPNHNTVYQYEAQGFDEEGTGVEKILATFNEKERTKRYANGDLWGPRTGNIITGTSPTQLSFRGLQEQIDTLQETNERLSKEIALLWQVLGASEIPIPDEVTQELIELYGEEATSFPEPVCDKCGDGEGQKGKLHSFGQDLFHDSCIFGDQ